MEVGPLGAPRKHEFEDRYRFEHLFEMEVGPRERPESINLETGTGLNTFLKWKLIPRSAQTT